MPSSNQPEKVRGLEGTTRPAGWKEKTASPNLQENPDPNEASEGPSSRELVLEASTDGGLLLAEALGYECPDDLPETFTRQDGETYVRFLEKNRHSLKGIMADDPRRNTVTEWTSSMFGKIREAKRTTVLLRWFRDPIAEADKKGIQCVSPVIFNALLGIVILGFACVFFAMFVKH